MFKLRSHKTPLTSNYTYVNTHFALFGINLEYAKLLLFIIYYLLKTKALEHKQQIIFFLWQCSKTFHMLKIENTKIMTVYKHISPSALVSQSDRQAVLLPNSQHRV